MELLSVNSSFFTIAISHKGRFMPVGDIQRSLAVGLSLALLAGCASTPKLGGAPGLKVYQGSEMPAPEPADLTEDAHPYIVGPFDKLTIDVFGIPELSGREVQVDATGEISFPVAGTMHVAGQTPRAIESFLARRLRANYVRNPQVTVNLKEAVSQVLTIEGQVTSPGLYPIMGRMTLLRAMALAKGGTEFAKFDDVVVFRTVGGQRYAALFNVKNIRHGTSADPEVYANDVIVVGDSAARRLFKDLLTALPLLTTPILLINNVTK
jgi:polysaccharide export outer membrane protein